MSEEFIQELLYYVSGVIVLISAIMMYDAWGESTSETVAWTLALFGWLPDFIFGVINKFNPEDETE